jgi:Tannase and feruloyl esterase
MWCIKIRTGTGGPSTWSATQPGRAPLIRTSTNWIRTLRSLQNTAVNCFSIYLSWLGRSASSPGSSIEFYESVFKLTSKLAQSPNWIRLFMVPGMGHCVGGEGPDTFDKISLIERWVEKGKAPARVIAAHSTEGKVDRTRPLCPYAQVARYIGTGSIDEASNFTCRLPTAPPATCPLDGMSLRSRRRYRPVQNDSCELIGERLSRRIDHASR